MVKIREYGIRDYDIRDNARLYKLIKYCTLVVKQCS